MITSKLRHSPSGRKAVPVDLCRPAGTSNLFHSPDYATIGTAKLIEVSTSGDAAAWLEFISRFQAIIAVAASRAAAGARPIYRQSTISSRRLTSSCARTVGGYCGNTDLSTRT
jgi:hypothetical protein